MNLLTDLTPQTLTERALTWDHTPTGWMPLEGGGIRVMVPAKADYFRDPTGKVVKDNAPFLWTAVTGDFVARALVRPTFAATYDSGVLMVRHNEETWAKLCFEKTDFGTTAAVSVVTRGLSDDANGADLDTPELWLQIARAGNVFALHYSIDGQNWRMVRIFSLDVPGEVRVGVVAQCPAGDGATVDLLHFSVDKRTPANIRTGG